MKIITLLTLSSVFALGLLVSSSAQASIIKGNSDSSANLRIVIPPESEQSAPTQANHAEQAGTRMACVSSFSSERLKETVKKVLRENPEILMEVLEHQSIELAELVDRGSMLKVVKDEEERRMEELAHPKVADIDQHRPIRGNPKAAITIVEYSDFECPFCEAAHKTIKKVLQKHGKTVRFVYKHTPLEFHALAEPAARYFEAIALQNPELAWTFHDRVFEEQSELGEKGEEGLKVIASALAIDQGKLEEGLQSQLVDERLTKDREEAERFGFEGTPAFLVNGVSLMGNRPIHDFEELIDLAVTEQFKTSASKVPEIQEQE